MPTSRRPKPLQHDLAHLLDETLRFNEIRRRLPNVTQRLLTNPLRELEADGLIRREIFPQVPPKVEYSLTGLGHSLQPIVLALKHWGDAHAGLMPGRGSTRARRSPRRPDAAQSRRRAVKMIDS